METGEAVAGGDAVGHDAHVLICDDTDSIRALLRLNLELEGYQVSEALSGKDALDQLRRAERVPDLVTLDALMPQGDGWQAVREIRADARLADLPVVMVTASVQNHDRDRAVRAGVDAFVAKPFDPEQLLSVIERLISVRRSRVAVDTSLESSG